MPRNYYMPQDDSGKAALLEHLAARLPTYAQTLAIDPEDLAAVQADALVMRYTVAARMAIEAHARQWTAFRNLIRDGGESSGSFPQTLTLPAPVPAVPPGVVPRLAALVARLKTARHYNEAIGQDLRLIGAEQSAASGAWKPDLVIASRSGYPVLQWTKGQADALELWVDRGDGQGFAFLTIATDSRYTDRSPAAGGNCTYKAVYRLRDAQVGQWSNLVSLDA